MPVCECGAELQLDGICSGCGRDYTKEDVPLGPTIFGKLVLDLSAAGAGESRILERIREHWAFMYEYGKQRSLQEQEISPSPRWPLVLFAADETYGYLQRTICIVAAFKNRAPTHRTEWHRLACLVESKFTAAL